MKTAFPPGRQTLESLVAQAHDADFAVFMFAPDDWTRSKSELQESARDNVVFGTNETTHVQYVRAQCQDERIGNGKDVGRRIKLIARRLKERDGMAKS